MFNFPHKVIFKNDQVLAWPRFPPVNNLSIDCLPITSLAPAASTPMTLEPCKIAALADQASSVVKKEDGIEGAEKTEEKENNVRSLHFQLNCFRNRMAEVSALLKDLTEPAPPTNQDLATSRNGVAPLFTLSPHALSVLQGHMSRLKNKATGRKSTLLIQAANSGLRIKQVTLDQAVTEAKLLEWDFAGRSRQLSQATLDSTTSWGSVVPCAYLEERPSGICPGRGVWASKTIPAGTWLGFYSGFICHEKEVCPLFAEGLGNTLHWEQYALSLDNHLICGGKESASLLRLVNDGAYSENKPYNPTHERINVRMVSCLFRGVFPLVGFVSTKTIPLGTECLTSYGEQYWSNLSIIRFVTDRQAAVVRKVAEIHNLGGGDSPSSPVVISDDSKSS